MNQLQELLREASGLDIPLVGIGMIHPLLKNEHFPWPKVSLFVPNEFRHNGWPAAWELARRAGIYAGCGNAGQAQINNYDHLPSGVWQLQADGWVRIA